MELDRFIEEARSRELLTHTEILDQKEVEAVADQKRIELTDQESLALLRTTWEAVHRELTALQPTSEPYVMVMDVNRARQYDRNRPKYNDHSWKSKRKTKIRNMLADNYAVPAWDMMQRITIGTTESGFDTSSMHLGSNGVIYRGLNDTHSLMRTANGTYHGSSTYKSADDVPGLWQSSDYRGIEIDNRSQVIQGLVNLAKKHDLPIDLLNIGKSNDAARDLGKSAIRNLSSPTKIVSLDDLSWEEMHRIIAERSK